jgi:hypothetical protein
MVNGELRNLANLSSLFGKLQKGSSPDSSGASGIGIPGLQASSIGNSIYALLQADQVDPHEVRNGRRATLVGTTPSVMFACAV